MNVNRDRRRFQVKDVEQLSNKWIVAPDKGEEHWVGALYTMFAHLIPNNSSQKDLWLLPRTFCGLGLDSLAVEIDEHSFAENVHKGLEYKYSFYCDEVYNHPFIVTDCIVCWELDQPTHNTDVQDDYDFFGKVSLSKDLKDIGYEIINIQSRDGDSHSGTIKVICLEKLLNQTFDIEWKTIPPMKKK